MAKSTDFHGISKTSSKHYIVRVWSWERACNVSAGYFADLEEALKARNEVWFSRNRFTLKAVTLNEQILDDEIAKTNTGYARISEGAHRGVSPYFSLTLRNLRDGRWAQRTFGFGTDRRPISRDQALRTVLQYRDIHAMASRPIIGVYNDMAMTEATCLAERELETLTPQLYTLKGFSKSRWIAARSQFPDELIFDTSQIADLARAESAAKKLAEHAR